MTHEPLGKVPRGWINLHGHMHGPAWPVSKRHLNVNVEQIGYRPARLDEVLAAGHAIAEGRLQQGMTTTESIVGYRRQAELRPPGP